MAVIVQGSIKKYLTSAYINECQDVKDISKSDDGTFFVDSDIKGWNFDLITKKLFPKRTPASVDGIFIKDRKIFFVEFKSGLKKLIDWKNFDPDKVKCPVINEHPCAKIGNLLRQRDNYKVDMLKYNFQIKAAESFITFKRRILSQIAIQNGECSKYTLEYIVVIDTCDSALELSESIEIEMSEEEPTSVNYFSLFKNSLRHFGRQDLWFDKISVYDVDTFKDVFNSCFKS